MDRILLASDVRDQPALTALLRQAGYSAIDCAASGGEARRRLAEGDYTLVLINAPLSDEFGRDLALACIDKTAAAVVLLAAASQADRVAAGLEKQGVCVLAKPIGKQLLTQSLRLVMAASTRLQALEKRNRQLTRKLENIQYIGRAKCALIQYRGMTEPQAHHYIEQMAMDHRVTARDIAADILHTFEDE